MKEIDDFVSEHYKMRMRLIENALQLLVENKIDINRIKMEDHDSFSSTGNVIICVDDQPVWQMSIIKTDKYINYNRSWIKPLKEIK